MSGKSADAYRTISEAGEEAGLPAHVLRFWESKFIQIKPVKKAGGRRLYRPHDINLLKGLKHLLYEEGYTIKGAQKYLKDHGVAGVCALADGTVAPASPGGADAPDAAGAAPQIETPPARARQPVEMRDDEDWPRAVAPGRASGPIPAHSMELTPAQRSAAQRALDHVQAARARLDQVLGPAG
ncbi:MerR family transcriptional regulator [Hyphomonadaceae bacterium BL14]|nr:MerR family transcriptional regulator [Hyphomonadaceae bacterium BL14]